MEKYKIFIDYKTEYGDVNVNSSQLGTECKP